MKNAFRKKHLLEILDNYSSYEGPLDLFLRNTFKKLRQIGSKDRKEIAETIYSLIRHQGYYDYFCEKPISWEKRLNAYELALDENSEMPDHIKVSFPKFLFNKLANDYGIDCAINICKISNDPAPTTIRANLLKTSREELIKILSPHCKVVPCEISPLGINLSKRINFNTLDAFKNGLFEVQDEASQLAALLAKVQPHEKVLDYCAGSGGKSLAFGPFMKNKGLLCLHDIRLSAIIQAKKRFKRSGIQNVQFISDQKQLKRYKYQMDWIFLDVPCSGTGTLRRNPDMKWKLDNPTIDNLIIEQRKIFEKALQYLKPTGKIVYATCSILKDENENQIKFFEKTFQMQLINEPFSTFPCKNGMDGFFGAVLQKKKISL